jgi:hypothetical protein
MIAAPSDQDEHPAEDYGPLEWDEDWAKWLLEQYALVGITIIEADGETVRSQGQYHGRVVEVNRSGVTIACEGHWHGETVNVPPDQRAFNPARPGEYRLRSTGEVIKDPDVLTNWTIHTPPSDKAGIEDSN